MKSDQEIKKVVKSLEKELEGYNLCRLMGTYTIALEEKIKLLKWVLEDSEPTNPKQLEGENV